MRPGNLVRFYVVRMRARLWQECFAVAGIATGVALLFASQVSSSSLQNSVGELSRGLLGNTNVQLLARGPRGFPQSTLTRVRRIPGVSVAAPLLESPANLAGPRGDESVELIGTDSSLTELGGALVRRTQLRPFGGIGAVVLPAPVARAIGVTKFGQEANFQIGGRTVAAPLYAQLHRQQIGPLVANPIAIAPLSFAQEMTGLTGRVSRILVHTTPGAQGRVRDALQAIAGGRLIVAPASYDQTLFSEAATASSRSTQLFAVIGALVGFLFAFNAMLFTVPQRRSLIAHLRRDGYTPATVTAVLLLDAFVLGLMGCVLGLALGEALVVRVLHSDPAFLSLAFAVGSQRVVSWQSVLLASAGGMFAAITAVLTPLRDLRTRTPRAANLTPTTGGVAAHARWLALGALACLGGSTVIVHLAPQAAVAAMPLLVGALLLMLPLALSLSLSVLRRVSRAFTGTVAHIAQMELSSAPGRAVAIAATGAVAVFGSVSVQGAHSDLLAGLDGATREMSAPTDLWISPAGSYDLLKTAPFAPVEQKELERVPGVLAVRIYRGGLLDYGARRLLVTAPPPQAEPLLPAGQILQGDPRQAAARVRAGGWLVLSRAVAEEHHLKLGQAVTLPTPDPTSLRLAALSTNLGWAPGALVMNAQDYARAWGSADASAYEVLLSGRAPRGQVLDGLEHVLKGRSSLVVQSAHEQTRRQSALSHRALARLAQIATLILIAAVLAMAAAMGALIWQRRPRLAQLKLDGLPRAELWRTIVLESALLLGVGCLTGAAFGIYGQQLADHALASAVNFPVTYSVTALAALSSSLLVIAAALAIVAVPGLLAVRAPATLALQD